MDEVRGEIPLGHLLPPLSTDARVLGRSLGKGIAMVFGTKFSVKNLTLPLSQD